MPRLDLDIEATRIDILRRQQEAIRPFQEELRALDAIERLVDRSGAAQYARPVLLAAPAEGKRPLGRPKKKKKLDSKPNGHFKGYRGQRQKAVIEDILASEPGLNTREIVSRMTAGGYQFASKEPVQSIGTTLRYMVQAGRLKPKTSKREGVPGEVNTYTLTAGAAPEGV